MVTFLIQRVAGRNLTLTQISRDVLRIGRGTNQDLRSENPAVALEHALIESDAAGYLITDKGSITGTYVNGKPVETARLAKGDSIEIGDLKIDIQIAEPRKPLFLRVEPTRVAAAAIIEEEQEEAVAAPGAQIVRARKFDYVAAYRLHRVWLTKVSVTALLLIIALAVIGEVIEPERQQAFMPGGLSSAHARHPEVANDCDACHTPWKSVVSTKCLDCHPQQPHAELEKNPPDCFACHAEHRGATKLAAIGDTTCTGCHADLAKHITVANVNRKFAGNRYDFASIAKIASFGDSHPELTYPRDANTLRFNHRLHLAAKGVFNGKGRREVLQCTGCHELVTVRGKSDPVAIDFEKHCQHCHKLTFDARFPLAEVPHGGDPGIVYGFVLATVSGDRDIAGKAPAEVRRILTTRKRIAPDERAILNAEQVIKTKCKQCHDILRQGTRLAVLPPVIPTQWLTHAHFTHGRHRLINCEKCHDARTSSATSDVLLPRRANCTDCHAKTWRTTQASSTCVSCHEYHFRPQRPLMTASLAQAGSGGLGSGGRMLQGILLAAIVILLLVVLIPVGIAIYQRMRPERPAAAPKERAAPPRAPSAATPTTRIPALSDPSADKPTDRIAKQPPPDLTPPAAPAPPRATPPPKPGAAPNPAATIADSVALPSMSQASGGGTEMVQWFGMLHCTSGALEGQRFIVEDEGFYIGRDPSLAKVVVPDSRVSKRHLRIVPRDGRVWAIDEGSTNGTFLKGQRISEVQLKRGDTLVLGDNAATFVYQI
ncbi:MAG TPA: FHA domain-containing protein [Thermoanaerobaculia bacterium]|nr:FHA domain-containing protein [Thermoanaerobaculia bacterium]